MTLVEFLLSLNILDIMTDFTFFIQYNYPNIWLWCDTTFLFLYELILNFIFILINSLHIAVNMKYLNSAIFNMGFKFILLIALLVFVRGGIPRYRFDFLTKIGWIKFLSLILSIFLSSMLLIFLF